MNWQLLVDVGAGDALPSIVAQNFGGDIVRNVFLYIKHMQLFVSTFGVYWPPYVIMLCLEIHYHSYNSETKISSDKDCRRQSVGKIVAKNSLVNG